MTTGTKRRDRRSSPWLLAMLLALVVLLLSSAAYTRALRPVDLPEAASKEIVHIQEGAGLRDIANLLGNRGYLRSPIAFKICAVLSGQAGQLKSGKYEVSSAMSAPQMVRMLAEGQQATVSVTVPEGFSVAQIAERVAELDLANAQQFQAAATASAVAETLGHGPPAGVRSAEGYLFPETYKFALDITPERIVARMVAEFRQRFVVEVWDEVPTEQRWGSLHEVVTLASLVEEEAQVDSERALIAGVYRNRLKRGIRLECDATVQYALGVHKTRLTHNDLKTESPYNTYRHTGLPPGPISNPGLASLRAALDPALTEYLFYVARGDGSHIFSRTHEEHKAAKSNVRGDTAR